MSEISAEWDSLQKAVEALRKDFPRPVTTKTLIQSCQELQGRVEAHLEALQAMTRTS